VEQARPLFDPADHPALWMTERISRVSVRYFDARFAEIRDLLGLDSALSLHCLRHSYVTHLVEFGYPERFVQVLLSPDQGVYDVQHGESTVRGLRGGGGYLTRSMTQIPRRFDAGSTGLDARLVA